MKNNLRLLILRSLLSLLIPLTKLLLINGIGYREFDEILRRAFVRSASVEFGIRGREANTSLIAAVTGLPRKAIQKFRRESDSESLSAINVSRLNCLLEIWTKDFQNKNGSPEVPNSRSSSAGSFASLSRLCMGDIPVGAVKSALVGLGAVTQLPSGRLILLRSSTTPIKDDPELVVALESLGHLAKTISHNLDPCVSR